MINSRIISKNYNHKFNLFEFILKNLKLKGLDISNLNRNDISWLDKFQISGSEITKEIVKEVYLKNSKVLDYGCGLGGTSRMLADVYNCDVTGIDLCKSNVRMATKLSKLTGLSDKTEFVNINTIGLPFKNQVFDFVLIQQVQMNINDKEKFYKEIKRVLIKEGILIFYDAFIKNDKKINYPIPWADNPSQNFMQSIKKMDQILNKLGFKRMYIKNQTQKAKLSLVQLLKSSKTQNSIKIGLNILMGKRMNNKLENILKAIDENKLELQSGIYRK